MIHNPKVGDFIRVPQNVMLTSDTGRWLKLKEPRPGFIVSIKNEAWPVTYKLFVDGRLWNAYAEDFSVMEDGYGKICRSI